jgi:hypothetical protein
LDSSPCGKGGKWLTVTQSSDKTRAGASLARLPIAGWLGVNQIFRREVSIEAIQKKGSFGHSRGAIVDALEDTLDLLVQGAYVIIFGSSIESDHRGHYRGSWSNGNRSDDLLLSSAGIVEINCPKIRVLLDLNFGAPARLPNSLWLDRESAADSELWRVGHARCCVQIITECYYLVYLAGSSFARQM